MGRFYLSVEDGETDCTPTGCPFFREEGYCDMLAPLGLSCDRVDLSTLRRCDDGEVVAVK